MYPKIRMTELMARKRLSREESRAQTRERLLDAGKEVFIKVGIDAASLEEVAETAGYSRGAFYSNFANKDELVVGVLEMEIQRGLQELNDLFAQDLPPMERLAVIRSVYLSMSGDIDDCMFWMGIRLYAVRNPDVRPKIAEILRSHTAAVAGYVRRMYEELGKEPPAPPEVIAVGLLAQAQGLALSRMVDPESISVEEFGQALGIYFDRLIGV
jgi:AcrR family transcriptional regulator